MVSFPDPHHPFNPPGKYWDMYRPDEFSVPEAFRATTGSRRRMSLAGVAEREPARPISARNVSFTVGARGARGARAHLRHDRLVDDASAACSRR